MGTLCWLFLAWGSPMLFAGAYGSLFFLNLAVVTASVKRKYRALSSSK
jgi:hypothetical protein